MIPEADIHPSASQELEEATDFYNRRGPGLAERFLRAAEKAIEQILLLPEASPVVGKTVRKKVLTRFPYSVLYLFGKTVVFIVAIAHHKQRPMYWTDRLPATIPRSR